MKSCVMWIWSLSWDEIGGARVCRMFVNVGSALERNSPPTMVVSTEP